MLRQYCEAASTVVELVCFIAVQKLRRKGSLFMRGLYYRT